MGRISRDRRDIYYRRAKEEGFRARSAYKLLQLDDELHFLSPPKIVRSYSSSGDSSGSSDEEPDSNRCHWPSCVAETGEDTSSGEAPPSAEATSHSGTDADLKAAMGQSVWDYPHRAVDLCAAPGSWTQVLRRRLWQNYELKLADYNSQLQRQQQQGLKRSSGESTDSTASGKSSSAAGSGHALSADATSLSPPDPPMIVAVDLQELAPVPGVFMLKGDITHASTSEAILSFFKHQPADLVVCDGAPDVTGMRDIDEFIQMQLLLAALGTASQVLRPGGTFVCKIFRGEQAALLYMQLMALFADVRCCKPAASRSSSVEAFVVCRGFSPDLKSLSSISRISERKEGEALEGEDSDKVEMRQATMPESHCTTARKEKDIDDLWGEQVIGQLVPFLSCGDIRYMDADRNYNLSKCAYTPKPPTQSPTHPAYELAVLRKKGLLSP
ncbi:putative tRNA (cytidine(32)/guanosine(34)-2'-O)-methyltransferase [Cyclospora cayetanensis]|uniref:tRNA (Cytidine(32)/guanosine(34)-2'-O)-methyltransferase n=2 Tax=Cyclospora cayetanensis TaxID=88456 RepID=A0A6P5WDL7_9EIME|nr:putative tRNA (cytidine(32)/guanosine(34)-2'-O)-methyltransferase [Cyclospora cayetanensis]OEH78294.1 ribosomal RNA large subunit methyltransferase [Cyclospora cayetanensis]